ncbi:D-alanyl-D-alanine carboxypeptidase family protein [Pseudogracilibacillus sp. SE30717A]|uniref:D-alanyl-D-alanine carboxypeptidase family protein n=1 Tax=Pseudogracilibacillus sp. SE30717A TaxID=3098293 RepID=UPI00300E4A95
MRLFLIRTILFFILFFFLFPPIGQSVEELSVSANNAVLIEASSGRILFEKEAHEKRPIASITKVMTAIIAIEQGNLDDMVKVSKRAVHTEGSSIYLQENEKMSLKDLLYGLMLRSGNDASVAIAEHIGGSVEGFTLLMNEKARYLGMTNTHFANPHGLDEDGHFSSAYDIAILMRNAMENDIFKEISASENYQSEDRTYKWINKNKLLTQYYNYCTGGKTGFTKKAGRTLVTTAEKDSLSLIVVTLDGPDDWNDHTALFEWGFNEHSLVKLESKGQRIFVSGESLITGLIKDDILLPLRKEEYTSLRKKAIIKDVSETTSEETKIGTITYLLDGEKLLEVPVYYSETGNDSFTSHLIEMVKSLLGFDKDG